MSDWKQRSIQRGNPGATSDRFQTGPVMASLYILILMTPAAKPALSLQQVPQPPLESEKPRDHSTSRYHQPARDTKRRRGRTTAQRGKDAKSKVKTGDPSSSHMANKFLTHFPWLKHGVHILLPPPHPIMHLPPPPPLPWERDWLLFGVCEKWESEAGQWDSPRWEAERSHLKSVSQRTD